MVYFNIAIIFMTFFCKWKEVMRPYAIEKEVQRAVVEKRKLAIGLYF